MKFSTIKLVTIIAPKKLKDEIVALLKSAGISGYTYYYVFGAGEKTLKGIESQEAENVKFRVLVPPLLAVTLMKVVAEKFFEREKVIAFEHDAGVIRYKKFDKAGQGHG